MLRLKLLFVSKDVGDTKMILPIAKEALVAGHDVFVVAEGKGANLYSEFGIETFFLGTPDFEEVAFTIDQAALLRNLNPSAVIVGFPGPLNLSKKISLEANAAGIPVVGVEDYWACVKRMPEVMLSLVLTIDDYAVEIAKSFLGQDIRISVVGNHTVPGPDYRPSGDILDGIKELHTRFEEIFVFGGGRENTTDELKLLVSSLQKISGNWCLIPRYHQNYLEKISAGGRKFRDVWDELLLPLGNRVIRFETGTSDDLAMVCDAYFSGCGSSMNTAIACGKPTVAVVTKTTMEVLRNSCLDIVPAVRLGGAQILTEVCDLRPMLTKPEKSVREKFKPLNAKLALKEIEKLFYS